jgi:hypothetical protein
LQQFGLVSEPQKTAVSGTVQRAERFIVGSSHLCGSRADHQVRPDPKNEKGQTMRSNVKKLMIAGFAAAALAATATTSSALPVNSGSQTLGNAAPAATTDVRWRGRHHHYHGWGWGAAALGLGIAAATAPYYYGGYGPYYGYYDPYYGGCYRDGWGRVWCR